MLGPYVLLGTSCFHSVNISQPHTLLRFFLLMSEMPSVRNTYLGNLSHKKNPSVKILPDLYAYN